jgi:hypothetical protein
VDSGEDSDEVVHVARVRAQKLPEPQGWIDGAPTSARDHSCAMCSAAIVEWVHPLAAEHVRFVRYGQGATWASYCTLCDPCERIYASGDDDAVVELMKASDGWLWQTAQDVEELIRNPLAALRLADKGPRRLTD